MNNTKKLTAVCDICKQQIRPASNPAKLKRNMGLHKRAVHGINGVTHQRYLSAKFNIQPKIKAKK